MIATVEFRPWRRFRAIKDDAALAAFLRDTADTAHRKFRAGSEASRGGRTYRKSGGRIHRASADGAWPARDTGRLLGSIRTEVTGSGMRIGTSMFYATFLRNGTRKMRRRKMSDDALIEALRETRPRMRSFARFR